MHKTIVTPALLLLLTLPLAGCNKIQARAEFKKGNEAYRNEAYVEALKQFREGLELDPDATFVWRSVGLAALALYKPGDESAKNQEYGQLSTEAFQKYLADYPEDEKVHEYLLTTLVNTKKYDESLAYLDKRAEEVPEKANELRGLKVTILTQAGRLEDAWQVVRQAGGPNQAENLYSIGVAAWDKSYNDATIDSATRHRFVDMGLQAMEQALRIRPEYFDAMVYYNLLYREKAKLQTDAALRTEYLARADEWQQKALALRKKTLAAEKKAQPAES